MVDIVNFIPSATAFQINATQVAPAGYKGVFMNGLYRIFSQNGTFTVPSGISKIRVRVVGAGGAGTPSGAGGGGAEYAHGTFTVTPGTVYSVTVGQGVSSGAGGSSAFGALISAMGGGYSGSTTGAPGGTGGSGGDYRAAGGASGTGTGTGGGGSGSQLGPGGASASSRGSGGGAVGGIAPLLNRQAGNSPFGPVTSIYSPGPDIIGTRSTTNGANNPINASIRFPFDGFTGGGGASGINAYDGGVGAGGGGGSSSGGGGGGGTGGSGSTSTSGSSGRGGIGAGTGGNLTVTMIGSNGIVIVEW